jgi:hypothetical protein
MAYLVASPSVVVAEGAAARLHRYRFSCIPFPRRTLDLRSSVAHASFFVLALLSLIVLVDVTTLCKLLLVKLLSELRRCDFSIGSAQVAYVSPSHSVSLQFCYLRKYLSLY